jgi:hypothetical protein
LVLPGYCGFSSHPVYTQVVKIQQQKLAASVYLTPFTREGEREREKEGEREIDRKK